MFDDLLDRLEQPEYTGRNRCLPCTIVNLVIAAILGTLVARKSRTAGLFVTVASIALVYLRGYLVPGTPTLTKRYLPATVLDWFGKGSAPAPASGFSAHAMDSSADETGLERRADSGGVDSSDGPSRTAAGNGTSAGDTSGDSTADSDAPTDDTPSSDAPGPVDAADGHLDLERYFRTHGVLEPCADEDDLCLTDEFERAWFDRIESVDESGLDAALVIDAFDFDAVADDYELRSGNETYSLVSETAIAGRWPSRAALLADVAASRTLEHWVPDWDVTAPETKGQLCNALRMFLERCPTGGDVTMGEAVVESCCTSHDVIAVTCEETGERLFEQRLDALG
ncbi:hypothetical protein [Natrarchaeobaculum sulfurireducens]|uniref:Uncharacterized protein n=1 Tax=Natrarchaeobaculum sulfurireducens TaxID=2044521 RepID=A0A346PKL2_9EURY|nr:hypothetical protein [Natrarchaeobaculum sulfurireducens]AXR80057.1 hypothetical protein AArcMg_0023 [Natrarchaeobaculum sulfurireducens]